MKIKGWAVFSGCYVKGLGNSWVHRSTWNTLSSAKYFMPSTCCIVLNELWGENGDLSCKVFKGNANSDTHTCSHAHTHTRRMNSSYIHFFASGHSHTAFSRVNILALKKSKLKWEQESGVNGVSLKKLSFSSPLCSTLFLPWILISVRESVRGAIWQEKGWAMDSDACLLKKIHPAYFLLLW